MLDLIKQFIVGLVTFIRGLIREINSEVHDKPRHDQKPRHDKNSQHAQPKPAPKPDKRFERPSPPPKKTDWKEAEQRNRELQENDPLKARGDAYEIFIGRQFETKGDLVIYNGLLRGYEDQGVDLIVIARRNKEVYLVQCKNWQRYEFTLNHIEVIYEKLNRYQADYFSIDPDAINYYLALSRPTAEIRHLLEESRTFKVRLSLFLASDRVVNLEIGKHLQMTGENIFRYKDMKMVVQNLCY